MTLAAPASWWLAAAESSYATSKLWRSWADSRILALEASDIPAWILDLSVSRSAKELWTILSPAIDLEVLQGFNRQLIYDAVLGYLWLCHERGDWGLKAFLDKAGRHADSYGTSIECEVLFALSNELQTTELVGDKMELKSYEIVLPYVALARDQWAALWELVGIEIE